MDWEKIAGQVAEAAARAVQNLGSLLRPQKAPTTEKVRDEKAEEKLVYRVVQHKALPFVGMGLVILVAAVGFSFAPLASWATGRAFTPETAETAQTPETATPETAETAQTPETAAMRAAAAPLSTDRTDGDTPGQGAQDKRDAGLLPTATPTPAASPETATPEAAPTPEPTPEPTPVPTPDPGPGGRVLGVYTPQDLPAYPYIEEDGFATADNGKGVIGLYDEAEYGSNHTMWTIDIADCVSLTDPGADVWDQACWYTYNGVNYCMNAGWVEAQIQDRFIPAKQNGLSLSVVFVLSYQPGREYLIDGPARVPGYRFYQPATTGEGAGAVEAFFDFFIWRCLWDEVRVDNFILGNEINNPNGWNHTGTLDAGLTAQRYATVFLRMYNAVRRYSDTVRCSISLDHNWTWNDEGREIPGKTLLQSFDWQIENMQPGVDWDIAYHLYPAIMGNTNMWWYRGYTPNSEYAMFVDAMNLSVLTDYVRDNFGENHRIMLTEQGVTSRKGYDSQAAALAIMYYAAKYNPMVDCFILNRDHSEYATLNFVIQNHRAEGVYALLDDGVPQHKAMIEQLVLNTTGQPLESLVPGYVSVQAEEEAAAAAAEAAAAAALAARQTPESATAETATPETAHSKPRSK